MSFERRNARYCPILTKNKRCRQISEELSDIKFDENPFNYSRGIDEAKRRILVTSLRTQVKWTKTQRRTKKQEGEYMDKESR